TGEMPSANFGRKSEMKPDSTSFIGVMSASIGLHYKHIHIIMGSVELVNDHVNAYGKYTYRIKALSSIMPNVGGISCNSNFTRPEPGTTKSHQSLSSTIKLPPGVFHFIQYLRQNGANFAETCQIDFV